MSSSTGRGRSDVLQIADTLCQRQVLSKSLHGNISIRQSGGDSMLMTGSSLSGIKEDDLAMLDLEGAVLEGHVAPAEHEIIQMHAAVYRDRDDVQCIIHTHSPFATAYAVANQDLPVFAESLARWDVLEPLPVAQWAPRGSAESVQYILAAASSVKGGAPGVLLQSHGVLVWGDSGFEAMRRTIAIEENAQLGYLAQALGGGVPLTAEMASAASARKHAFDS